MTPDAATFAAIAASLVASVAGVALVGARAHAYWRGAARPAAPPRPDEARLARLEMAVDAIAVEVERIGEGQRFLTRLHVGPAGWRAPDAAPDAASVGAEGGAS